MATNKSFQLYINDNNVKQYFTTSGGALNGASIGGKYITMRSSSSTSRFTMKDAGRNVLFPSAEAKANKVEIWAQTIASLNNSKNTINVAVAGKNAITTQKINTSLTERTGSVEGTFAKASTSVVYTIKIANGFHAAGVRDTSITAYFWQYSCAANAAGNGVKRVSVSNTEPYEGETVTFSAELYAGATWDGWYSDAACTNLISTEQIYTASAADLTLYANATIEAAIYNCSAVAGENIASASVSDESVVSGDSVTFTAQLNEHCTFDGWYSDSNYTTLVSTANPYTATITSDTTLYAKATKISYSVSVGTAEHGTATVSANTAHYGDSVTFTFTPEDETWELYGWYSDEELTQLVSESNPYTHSVTGNVTLYPKVEKKRFTITVGQYKSFSSGDLLDFDVISFYYDRLTKEEVRLLRTGEFDNIDQSKVIEKKSASGNAVQSDVIATILCPSDAYIAIYAKPTTPLSTAGFGQIKDSDGNYLTYWPYYWYQPSEDAFFEIDYLSENYSCNCSAIAKDGIDYAYATTPTRQEREAIFEAEVSPGYTFSGWYTDEACTRLSSTDNPAYIKTPKYITSQASATSVTLYAKATTTATVYNCSAVAGENVTSAAVSDNKVIEGGSVTFTATIPSYCVFDGWYTALTGGTKVSGDNPYTAIINSDTTLYARATKKLYTITLNQPDHGSATVSATTAHYDDQVTFTCYPDAGWQLLQWRQHYGSGGGWLEVSKSNPFVMTIRDNVVITPALTQINYNIGVGESEDGVASVSASTAHYGDNVVFTFTPNEGVEGNYGWYQDAELTQVVSRENPYVHTVTGNIMLYPGVVQQISTGFYIKTNGVFIEATTVYKKVDGAWILTQETSNLFPYGYALTQ